MKKVQDLEVLYTKRYKCKMKDKVELKDYLEIYQIPCGEKNSSVLRAYKKKELFLIL